MSLKTFYENQINFSLRTLLEYFISPGIKSKYDILKREMESINSYSKAIDLGCAGNSFLLYLEKKKHNCLLDLVEKPLKYYSRNYKFDSYNLLKKLGGGNIYPLNGDISNLPYRDNSFDLICALDVLEHLKDDQIAIKEMSRILSKGGNLIITTPRGMNYYTEQDRLIGHYRRYEINNLINILKKNDLRLVKLFGIYGRLFKITEIQSAYPDKVEKNIERLRHLYRKKLTFRLIWNLIVRFLSYLMKLDAKYTKYEKLFNIGLILEKK